MNKRTLINICLLACIMVTGSPLLAAKRGHSSSFTPGKFTSKTHHHHKVHAATAAGSSSVVTVANQPEASTASRYFSRLTGALAGLKNSVTSTVSSACKTVGDSTKDLCDGVRYAYARGLFNPHAKVSNNEQPAADDDDFEGDPLFEEETPVFVAQDVPASQPTSHAEAQQAMVLSQPAISFGAYLDRLQVTLNHATAADLEQSRAFLANLRGHLEQTKHIIDSKPFVSAQHKQQFVDIERAWAHLIAQHMAAEQEHNNRAATAVSGLNRLTGQEMSQLRITQEQARKIAAARYAAAPIAAPAAPVAQAAPTASIPALAAVVAELAAAPAAAAPAAPLVVDTASHATVSAPVTPEASQVPAAASSPVVGAAPTQIDAPVPDATILNGAHAQPADINMSPRAKKAGWWSWRTVAKWGVPVVVILAAALAALCKNQYGTWMPKSKLGNWRPVRGH